MSDRRHDRPRSPPLQHPGRSSMPTVNYGRYDDTYSIAPSRKDVYGNPRSSADRVNTAGNVVTTYKIAPDPPTRSSRDHEGSRSRRSTLDSTSKPVVVTTQGSRYPAVHGGDGSSTPLDHPFRASDEGDYYAIPASSGRHRGHYRGSSATMDNADMNRHLHETPEERLLRVGSGRDGTIYPKSRPIYPDTLVRRPDGIAEDYGDNGYGYTNPRDLVTYDLDPRRRPRRDSFESTRSARPLSISGGYPEMARSFDARERGPPPSTRGFVKIPYDAPGMRMPMPGEALPEPYEPGLTRRDSKSRRPVSVYHDDRRRPPQDDYYGISEDEKGRRKIPAAPIVPYDNAVEQRGFGIRLPGMDIHHHPQPDVPEIRTEAPPEKVDYDKHDKHDKDIYVDRVDDKRNNYDERSDKKNTKDHTKEALTAGLGVAAVALGLGAAKSARDDDKDGKETDNYRKVREAGKPKSYDVEDNGERDDYRRRRDHDDEARKRREAREDRDTDAAVVDLTGRDPKERRSREDRDSIDSLESKERTKDEALPAIDLSGRNPVEKPLVRDDRRDDREEARQERKREEKDRQEAIQEPAPEVAERRKHSGDSSPADLTPPGSRGDSPESEDSVERTIRRRRARQDAAARFNPKDAMDLRALKDAINSKETTAPPPIPPKEPLPKESTHERFDPRDPRDLASIRAELAKKGTKGEDRGRHSDSDDSLERRRPRLVSPPREDSKKADERPVKGILRQPREKFPEDPDPIREGVAPLKDAKKEGVPPNARWTKISRKLVNPEALELGKERYEARDDFVVVLRVLSKEEVQGYATVTQQIRAAREEEEERSARRRQRRERHERHRRERHRREDDDYEYDHDHRRHRRDRERDRESNSESDTTEDEIDVPRKRIEESSRKPMDIPKSSRRQLTFEDSMITEPGSLEKSSLREDPARPGTYTGYTRNPSRKDRDRDYD